MTHATTYVRPFSTLDADDVAIVGGKNASLGEMIRHLAAEGVAVPDGFATTADAYRDLLAAADLTPVLTRELDALHEGRKDLHEVGEAIRRAILHATWPDAVADAIRDAYRTLGEGAGEAPIAVAVRSSATAEDLPDASFAGQQETFLNVRGEGALLDACLRCVASLFTDRAIAYRDAQGFDHLEVALSVGVQRMVRSDLAGSGTMFTLDTETGFPDVVMIDAAWGLGETVVQGLVDPDAYEVFTPLLDDAGTTPIIGKRIGAKERKMVHRTGGTASTKLVDTTDAERRAAVLTDDEILHLARWAARVEAHYGRGMDLEWAKDGRTGELFILQARPETVQSRRAAATMKTYRLRESGGAPLVSGLAIGEAIATGPVQVIERADAIDSFEDGSILVTGMTDPDWVPIMKRASAIVTDHGGRTCHAAIVARELGIPAIAGTGDATRALEDGRTVTVSCAEGERGFVYDGAKAFDTEDVDLDALPEPPTTLMMNAADPAVAMRWWRLPVHGIGLARMEFLVNAEIGVHPMALVRYDDLPEGPEKDRIAERTRGYDDKPRYFVEHLARGLAKIAASRWPDPVLVRTSDFKTNEYADLLGGAAFEPEEANPMIGFRGAARYASDAYREAFALECEAIREVRTTMGFDNVVVMIPFCRTVQEADRVLAVMAEHGLRRGEDGLEVYVMAEIPANVFEARAFAERFDGFSIGSNDLTQLVLGVDRDSDLLAGAFDERDPAVKGAIRTLIEEAHAAGVKVGICGQAPSDHPDFAAFLVDAGIDSISLNPDSVVGVIRRLAGEGAEVSGPVPT